MELKRIKARVSAAHKHLRKTDRWAGGQPPYGYRIVDRAGGGRTLEPDPVTSEWHVANRTALVGRAYAFGVLVADVWPSEPARRT
ncbi:hypothetical protein ACIRYZ_19435 [Kitasatospora sp. NPDC101155]|uniref:hypothetical protein n=1 Tax=Kitasatospora sp. NPDC101155 TaxID=3364097 RepID=UPI00380F51AC